MLPETTTVRWPDGSRLSVLISTVAGEPAAPVVTRFTIRAYRVSGRMSTVARPPAVTAGVTTRSTMLSFTTIGAMVTPEPSSRLPPAEKSPASTVTEPVIRLIPLGLHLSSELAEHRQRVAGDEIGRGIVAIGMVLVDEQERVPRIRCDRFGSPLATRTRSPRSVPSAPTGPVRSTLV